MTPAQKEWIKLISIIFGTGCAAVTTAYLGGAKLWVSIVIGLGVAGTNVYHAMSDSPSTKTKTNEPQ